MNPVSHRSSAAVVDAASLQRSIRVEPLTCTIGAELSNVNLGAASRDTSQVAEIRALLLKHKVLFFRKVRIAELRARHSIEASFGAAMPTEKRLALKSQFPDAEHPVVRTHPETGEKILFVNAFTTHFSNYHTPEHVRFGQDYNPGAWQLLSYLVSQAFVPEYQVRWRWKKNSMAMWDNRSTQHYAVMDYPPCHRKMERAGIIGDLPY